jgi:hypothetical protein
LKLKFNKNKSKCTITLLIVGLLSLEVIQADLYYKSTNRFIFIHIDIDVA